MRRLLAMVCLFGISLLVVQNMAGAEDNRSFVGQMSNNSSSVVAATIRTPNWTPNLQPGAFLYSWVMETNSWSEGIYWFQIGVMESSSGPQVAEEAYVGGPGPTYTVDPARGEWISYKVFSDIKLTPGSDHRYEIRYSGIGDWWYSVVDNQIMDAVDLPSDGANANPEASIETNGVNAMPDIRFGDVYVDNQPWFGCSYVAEAPFSVVGSVPCSQFYGRV